MQGWARVSRLMPSSLVEEDQRASQTEPVSLEDPNLLAEAAEPGCGSIRVDARQEGRGPGGRRRGRRGRRRRPPAVGVPRRIRIGREGLNAFSHKQHGSCAVNPKP